MIILHRASKCVNLSILVYVADFITAALSHTRVSPVFIYHSKIQYQLSQIHYTFYIKLNNHFNSYSICVCNNSSYN